VTWKVYSSVTVTAELWDEELDEAWVTVLEEESEEEWETKW